MKRAPLVLLGLVLGLGLILWLQGREGSAPDAHLAGSGTDTVVLDGEQYTVVDVPTGTTPVLAGQPSGAAPEPTIRRALEIELLDPEGRPIAGQRLQCHPVRKKPRPPGVSLTARTDAQGIARFPDLSPETVEAYSAYHDAPVPPGAAQRAWWLYRQPIEGWRTSVRSNWGLPVDLQIVDGLTGEPMPDVEWGTGWVRPEGVGPTKFIGNTGRAKPGGTARFGFHVRSPKGYVAWDRTAVQSYVAEGAKQLSAVYPLRRELPLEVTLNFRGAFQGNTSFEVGMTGRTWQSVRSKSLGNGRFRIHGIPFLPLEPYELRVGGADVGGAVALRVPATLGTTVRAAIDLFVDNETHDEFEEIVDGPDTIGVGGTSGEVIRPQPQRGGLSVLCLLADGRPGNDVLVRATGPEWKGTKNGQPLSGRYTLSGKTDAAGRIAWPDAPAGEWQVQFRAWHGAEGVTIVEADQRAELTIREPEGGSLAIQVVTPGNHPLPYATLQVRHAKERHIAWRPLLRKGGTVRVDAYTDHLGRRTLERLFPGTHEVTVRFGTREKTVPARVVDRQGGSLVVVLEPPK